MPRLNIVREVKIKETPRVLQLRGIFDVQADTHSRESWNIDFDLPEQWNIGVIVGASGSGKSTIANELWRENIVTEFLWSDDKSVVDCFPVEMSIKEITELLSSVGFSSPPSWLRPFSVLSNGEKFRVTMARLLAERRNTIVVVDEYTSVVDRTVAQIGSAAIAKTIRKRGQQFIAVSCHYDILEWLQPDWIFEPATNHFYSGRYLQRPNIDLEIKRVKYDTWQLFRKHHYMSNEMAKTARCYAAFYRGLPIAFIGVLPDMGFRNCYRVSRLVVLPDFQGIGIGVMFLNYIASVYKSTQKRMRITTALSGLYRALNGKSWQMKRAPSLAAKPGKYSDQRRAKTLAKTRLTASFEYYGKGIDDKQLAERLIYGEIRNPSGLDAARG